MQNFITAFVLTLAIAASAAAATLGDAKTGFSADRVLIVDGKTYQGRMWTMPGVERHEQDLNGIPAVFVLRSDNPIANVVLPQLHTVVEFVLPPEFHLFGDPRLKRRPVGSETVGGIATTKYAIDETVPRTWPRHAVAQRQGHPDEARRRLHPRQRP